MFLPNTDSFVLTRRPIVKPGFFAFLPNADSFVLTRRPIVKPGFPSEARSTVAVTPQSVASTDSEQPKVKDRHKRTVASTDSEQPKVKDRHKRNFLKAAGVAGASIVASQLFSAKKAQALILGSSPTTGVVGVKDSANARINPATEETVSSLLKPSDLTFDAGSLQVKVTSQPSGSGSFSDSGDVAKSGLVDADRHIQVDVLSSALPTTASTETTLQTISFGGFKFSLRIDTVGDIDYIGEASIGTATSAAAWRIKRVNSATGTIIQWAGTGVFDQVWDNRASLTYS